MEINKIYNENNFGLLSESKEYTDIANKRIQKYINQKTLF